MKLQLNVHFDKRDHHDTCEEYTTRTLHIKIKKMKEKSIEEAAFSFCLLEKCSTYTLHKHIHVYIISK